MRWIHVLFMLLAFALLSAPSAAQEAAEPEATPAEATPAATDAPAEDAPADSDGDAATDAEPEAPADAALEPGMRRIEPVVPPAAAPAPPAEAQPDEAELIELEEGERVPGDDGTPGAEPTPTKEQNRMRLEFLGAALVPVSGQDVGWGLGGFVGYDFEDVLGVEMSLYQFYSETDLEGKKTGIGILSIMPGVRYRYWRSEHFRPYIVGHLGFQQVSWDKPEIKDAADEIVQFTEQDKLEIGFGADAGLGGEVRFANIVLVDFFALYQVGVETMPTSKRGALDTWHGLMLGMAIGIASPLGGGDTEDDDEPEKDYFAPDHPPQL